MKCWCWADIVPLQITPQGVKCLTLILFMLQPLNGKYPNYIYSQTCLTTFSSPETSEVPVEDQRLIVSVPSALHSQKPLLSGKYFQNIFLRAKLLGISKKYSTVVCFAMPPEGNAATSVIVILLYSFSDKL